MKIIRIHLVEIVAALLFIILIPLFYRGNRELLGTTGDMSYSKYWTYVAKEGTREYQILPESIEAVEKQGKIILRKQLPEDIASINSICFYTSHQLVEVYIGGELVYERKVPPGAKSMTPGNCWNFVQLWEEYAGQSLEVHIKNCYDSDNVKVPEFLYGSLAAVILGQIKSRFLSLIISFIMFAMGLMLVAGWFTLGKKMHFHQGIPWLGLFTVYFAVWSAFETQIPAIMFGRELLCNHITIMSLKLMPLPIIYFIQIIYFKKNSRLMNFLAWASVLEFAVSFIGQCVGWYDLRQTLWVTHLLGIFIAVTAMVLGLRVLLKKGGKTSEHGGKLWINIICICIVGVCMILDALNYYYGFFDDVASFSRIGCLIYIFVLTRQFVDDSVKLIQAGQQAEVNREKAELDGLTLLKNRRSFELDLHKIHHGDFQSYGVVMFDLNNLKQMNDLYGHGMGDCYIITGSEIIQDVFGEFGEVYRIGGDEFCLLSNKITAEIYEEKNRQMCDWLASLRGTQVKDFMQIASGFAKYNRSIDMNLQDVIERADMRMYQCKRTQKQSKSNGEKI